MPSKSKSFLKYLQCVFYDVCITPILVYQPHIAVRDCELNSLLKHIVIFHYFFTFRNLLPHKLESRIGFSDFVALHRYGNK